MKIVTNVPAKWTVWPKRVASIRNIVMTYRNGIRTGHRRIGIAPIVTIYPAVEKITGMMSRTIENALHVPAEYIDHGVPHYIGGAA